MKMSEQRDHLLLYLRQNKLINYSTIESLISYGFDSNETLLALDFDSDLPQITDICLAQKSLLRRLINEFKTNNNIENNDNISSDFFEALFEENFGSNLFIKSNKVFEHKNSKDVENNELFNNSSVSEMNESFSIETQSYANFDANNEKIISKSSYSENNSRKLIARKQTKRRFSEKRYKCEYKECNKTFITSSHLKRHINSIHKKLKPFKCDYNMCDYSCAQSYDLKKHFNSVHKKLKPFKCDYYECGYNSANYYDLKLHINSVHTKIKSFQCHYKVCNKKFYRKSHLNEHLSTHLGYKKFKCVYNECDFSSANSHYLKRHINSVHKNLKPFECHYKECDKNYSRKSYLNQHLNTI
jgi:uncharacterized Zn-finger protein